MEQFRNAYHSHEHSSEVLNLLYNYDDFMESITTVADMGCGGALDAQWWATLMNKEDPPEPYNYTVYAVDVNINKNLAEPLENLHLVQGNFEQLVLPEKVDLMWSHDSFQYAINPIDTLRTWNRQMNVNGMLVISVQQSMAHLYNRWTQHTLSGCYHNYNFGNLLYMLAISGFDCRDAYFYKQRNNPWLYAAVYKNGEDFLNPRTTTWYDLVDQHLVNDSVAENIMRCGYLRHEEIVYPWLDKDYHRIED